MKKLKQKLAKGYSLAIILKGGAVGRA